MSQIVHRNKTKQDLLAEIEQLQKKLKEKDGLLSESRSGKVPEGINLLDQISDAVILSDIHFVIRSWNLAAEEIYGWKAAEVIGKNVGDLVKSKFQIPTEQVIQQFFSQGTWKGEVIHHRKDGSPIHILGSVNLIKDEQGKPASVVSINRDITESKRAEEKLRESEEKYRKLVEQTFLGIGLSHGNQVIFANPALLHIFGYDDLEEFTKIPLLDHVAPSSRDQIAARQRKVAEEETRHVDFEYDILRKDGKTKTLYACATHITLGGETYTQTVFQDITERKQADEALRESEEKWRSLVNTLPDYVSLLDREGRFLFLNHYAEGFTDKDVIGSSVYQYFSTESKEIFEKEFAECQNTGKIRKFELTAMGDHGIMREYEYNLVPILEKNKATSIMVIARDITERKRADEALNVEQNLMDALMNNVPVQIYFKDCESRFIRINNATAQSLGLSDPGQAVGKTDFDFFTDEHAQQAYEDEQVIIETGQPISKEEKETRHDLPDKWVSTNKLPLRDKDEKIIGTFGTSVDITERKQAEEALRESEERYRTIVKNINDALYIHDFKGNILDLNENACIMLGYTRDELAGANLGKIDSEENKRLLPERMGRLLNESSILFEGSQVRKDGTIIPVEVSAKVISREGNGIIQGFVRDITERKQAEEALNIEQYLMDVLMDNVPTKIYFKDCESRFIRINNAQAQSFGLSDPGQAVGKTDFDFFSDEHAQQAYEDEQVIIETGQQISKEEKETWDDLPDKWVSTNKLPLRDKNEKVIGTFGTSVDITERKRAEDELRDSEVRFRSLFDDTPIALWEEDFSAVKQRLDDLRAQGVKDFNAYLSQHPEVVAECVTLIKVVDVNKATMNMFGASSKEDMLKNLTTILPEEAYQHFRDELVLIASGKTHFEMENINQTLDGRLKTVNMNWAVIPGYEGDLSKTIVSLIDITERKRAEVQIHEQLEELRRWHAATLGRENRALELKEEVNKLLAEAGQPPRYASAVEPHHEV